MMQYVHVKIKSFHVKAAFSKTKSPFKSIVDLNLREK
jgi:hypothetical protein